MLFISLFCSRHCLNIQHHTDDCRRQHPCVFVSSHHWTTLQIQAKDIQYVVKLIFTITGIVSWCSFVSGFLNPNSYYPWYYYQHPVLEPLYHMYVLITSHSILLNINMLHKFCHFFYNKGKSYYLLQLVFLYKIYKYHLSGASSFGTRMTTYDLMMLMIFPDVLCSNLCGKV